MKHRSDGATALLGMPGFVVGAQMEVDGEVWLHVETTAEAVGCASWGPERWAWPTPGQGALVTSRTEVARGSATLLPTLAENAAVEMAWQGRLRSLRRHQGRATQ